MEPDILADLADRFDPRHTALVIIDMQNDFCLDGYGAAQAGRDVRPAQNAAVFAEGLLDTARATGVRVAHVGFWTLPDHASDSGPWLAQRRRATKSSDKLCIAGSEGARFIAQLTPRPGEWTIHKHRYSAFAGTDLNMLLRSAGIRSLILAGVSTNACVESTARAAFDLDYYIGVATDAVASWDQALHLATLANVEHRLGVTLSSADIRALWNRTS